MRELIRDLMSVGVKTCPLGTPVPELARILLDKGLEAVVVLNDEGHAVGVVTRDDLVKVYPDANSRELTAEEVMRDGVPQVPPDIPLSAAAQIMRDLGVRVLFLMHHAGGIVYPAAVLSYTHLLRHLAAQDESELDDLGIKASREAPLDMFLKKRDEARRQSGLSKE